MTAAKLAERQAQLRAGVVVADTPRGNHDHRGLKVPFPDLDLYGLDRARREGWRLMRYPLTIPDILMRPGRMKRAAFVQWWEGEFERLRWAGAVVVALGRSVCGNGELVRWWFGLPPDFDLRLPPEQRRGDVARLKRLARAAGMLSDPPLTFAWRSPRPAEG